MIHVVTATLMLLFAFLNQRVEGQSPADSLFPTIRNLDITTNQTSILVFPTPIKSVDRGCPAVLTKAIKGISNVLKVKAATSVLPPSNLTVFTADGAIYGFRVNYSDNPAQFLLDYSHHQQGERRDRPLLFINATETDLNNEMDSVAKRKSHHIHAHSSPQGGVHCKIKGIFAHEGIAFFKLSLQNRSAVPYHVDFLRYFIRDRHRQKRTVASEKGLIALAQSFLPDSTVAPHGEITIIVAFNQFTIANNKQFFIEIFEHNGDRRIVSTLNGKQLLKAVAISD